MKRWQIALSQAVLLVLSATVSRQPGLAGVDASSLESQQRQHANAPAKPPAERDRVHLSIPDVEVLNQDGRRIHFYSDLIKGRVVVVSFVFTTCTAFCASQGAALNKFQKALGHRLGREVNIISVSIDPETDTPKVLQAWGTKFGARSGWTLVTGKRSEIDKIALSITGAPAMKAGHEPIMFIGNNEKGMWVRIQTLIEPERFMKIIEEMLSDSAAQASDR